MNAEVLQIITPILDNDAFRVMTVISLSRGSRFHRKELKERTAMNNVTIDKTLALLLNSGLIAKKNRCFFLNLENEHAKEISEIILKQYRQLREIPLNAYFSITDLVLYLSRFKNLDVYIFGSYSKLVFRETSDIDIAIISDSTGENKKEIQKAVQKTEKKYKKRIEIHYFGSGFYKNKKDPLVAEILRNGIKLI